MPDLRLRWIVLGGVLLIAFHLIMAAVDGFHRSLWIYAGIVTLGTAGVMCWHYARRDDD